MKKNSWLFISALFILVFIALRNILFVPGTVGRNWDWFFPVLPQSYQTLFYRYFFTWINSLNFGYSNTVGASMLPVMNLFTFLSFFHIGGDFYSKFSIVITFLISGISMYVLGAYLFRESKTYIRITCSCTMGFMYSFSPFLFNDFLGGAFTQFFTYALIPLGLYFFIKSLDCNKNVYIILTSLVLVLIDSSHQNFIFTIIIIVTYLFTFYFSFEKLKKTFLIFFLFSLLSLYWILPSIVLNQDIQKFALSQAVKWNPVGLFSSSTKLLFSFFTSGYKDRDLFLNSLPASLQWIPLASALLMLVMIIFSFFKISCQEKSTDRKRHFLYWFVIFLASVLFAKGTREPFSYLVLFLYEKIPFFNLFRSNQHFLTVVTLSFVILLGYAIVDFLEVLSNKNNKKFSKLFLLIIPLILIGFTFSFWWKGDLGISELYKKKKDHLDIYSMPKDLTEIYNYLEKQKGIFRLANLPLSFSPRFLARSYQRDGQSGDTDLISSSVPSYVADTSITPQIIYQIENDIYDCNLSRLMMHFKMTNTRFVLVKNDRIPNFNRNSYLFDYDKINMCLTKDKRYLLRFDYPDFKLYEIDNNSFMQKIYINQTKINNFISNFNSQLGVYNTDLENKSLDVISNDLIPYIFSEKDNITFISSTNLEKHANNVFVVAPEFLKNEFEDLKNNPDFSMPKSNLNEISPAKFYIYQYNKKISVNFKSGLTKSLEFTPIYGQGDLMINNEFVLNRKKEDDRVLYRINMTNQKSTDSVLINNESDLYKINLDEKYSKTKLFTLDIDIDHFGKDTFNLYNLESKKPVFEESFEKGINNWLLSDCSSPVFSADKVKYELSNDAFDGNTSISIISNGHTACLHKSIKNLIPGYYLLSFNYKSLIGGNPVFSFVTNTGETLSTKMLNTELNKWNTFNNIIYIDKNYQESSFYFYSEAAGVSDGKVTTLIDNIKLTQVNKIRLSDTFYSSIEKYKNINPWLFIDTYTPNNNKIESIKLAGHPENNLVANGSFEDNDIWSYSDCSGQTGPGDIIKSYQVDDHIDGKKSLELYSKNHTICTHYQIQDISSESVYLISFFYKNVKGGKLEFSVVEDGKRGRVFKIDPASSWSRFSSLYFPSPGTKFIDLYFYNTTVKDQVTLNRIDNVVFKKILDNYQKYLVSTEKIDFNESNSEFQPIISFREINPTKYKIYIHGSVKPFLLTFGELFNTGWKAYVTKILPEKENSIDLFSQPASVQEIEKNRKSTISGTILTKSNNVYDSTFSGQINQELNRNVGEEIVNLSRISSISANINDIEALQKLTPVSSEKMASLIGNNMQAEQIDITKFQNSGSLDGYIQNNYISKSFNNSVQNDNLPSGLIYETWLASQDDATIIPKKLQQKNIYKISENNHFISNSYANSWLVDIDSLKNKDLLKKNPDGTYDMEMTLEFWPQRLFYIGGVISGTTLLGSLIYLLYIYYFSIFSFFRKISSLHYWKATGGEIVHTARSVKDVYRNLRSMKHDRLNHRILEPVTMVSKKISKIISDSMKKREEENRRREMFLEGMMMPRQVVVSDSGKKLESELEKMRLEQELTRVKIEKELMEVKLEKGDKGRQKRNKNEFFDMEEAEKADYDDISAESVKVYREKYEKANGRALHIQDDKELLRELVCLTKNGNPTVGGILLFGKNPQKFLLKSYITVVRYKDIEIGAHDSRDFKGTLFEMVDKVIEYLEEHTQVIRRIKDKQLEREDIPVYPYFALREALINAVVHREYSIQGSRIIISMYPDKIEFVSPGDFPAGITPDTVIRAQYSRNPIVSRVFYDVKYIEQFGSGIDRIFSVFRKHPLKPAKPTIEVVNDSVILTFFRPEISND